jgi:phosphatidylinositol glycan class U
MPVLSQEKGKENKEEQKEQQQQDGQQEAHQGSPARAKQHSEAAGQQQEQQHAGEAQQEDCTKQQSLSKAAPQKEAVAPTWQLAVSFTAHLKLWCWCLVLLSDLALRDHTEQQCWPRISSWFRGGWLKGSPAEGIAPGLYGYFHDVLGGCWMGQTYGFLMDVTDLTPNLGLFWYFFTEMFDAFRPFFKFVFHAFGAVFLVPLAIRFPRRPLLLVFCQLLATAMFKPYPSVPDFVPWMALLPLFQQQLQLMQIKLFLCNSLALLLVLAPSMWHQWINLDAANANFFYSITLLLGVWYTLFLGHMVQLTARLEWALSPKGQIQQRRQSLVKS